MDQILSLDGDGSGSGSGYGSGYGSGSGYGYGSGDGYGSGYGYCSGAGYCDGAGYGDGSGEYWRATMSLLLSEWTPSQVARFARCVQTHVPLAFWRSDAEGNSANGGTLTVMAAPGVIHRESGPLTLCESGTLHASLLPPKWKGERVWIVALHGDVIGDEEKFGCLEREIIGEVLFRR